MSDLLQVSNPTDEIQPQPTSAETEMAKEKDLLSPEDGTSSNKGRGLLKVPSRSSSQRNQSSPTSTGLSGATVSDPRNSIGSRSKDSKGSLPDRRRNGSTSSNRTGGDTEPTNTPASIQPSSPAAPAQKKKSRGLLAFLGCCVSPESPNSNEGTSENSHKLDRLPQRPTSAKSRTNTPQEQPKPTTEKEIQPPVTASENKNEPASSGSTNDEITVAERDNQESKQSIPPAVTVDPPEATPTEEEPHSGTKVADSGDVDMRDAPIDTAEVASAVPTADEPTKRTIPPPPPPPATDPTITAPATFTEAGPSAPEPQKWLLPPLTQELKGRKCLVLDLDETLVHSSFKVGSI